MRRFTLDLFLAVCTAVSLVLTVGSAFADATGAEVRVGDSRDLVREHLGEPRGRLEYDDTEILFYERGRVELVRGVVAEVRLISAEAFERDRAAREEEAARQRAAREKRMAERYVEGVRVREGKLADTAFMNAPASQRVAYWQEFKRRYPNVEVGEAYLMALAEQEEVLAARAEAVRREQRIADLEVRVAQAEERARRAEEEAVRNRPGVQYWGVGYTYPVYLYNRDYPSKRCKPLSPASPLPSSDLKLPHRGYHTVRSCGVRPLHPSYASGYTRQRSGLGVSAHYRHSSLVGRVGVRF